MLKLLLPAVADNSDILDMLHKHTCWDLEEAGRTHRLHNLAHTHSNHHSTDLDLAEAEPIYVQGRMLV